MAVASVERDMAALQEERAWELAAGQRSIAKASHNVDLLRVRPSFSSADFANHLIVYPVKRQEWNFVEHILF